MKKMISFFISSIIIVSAAFGIYMYTNMYHVEVLEKGIKSEIYMKGFKGAKAFTSDESGNIYIAYNDEIVKVNNENKIVNIIKDSNLEIEDILYSDKKLIILSKDKLISYDIENEKKSIISEGILYKGENIDRNLLEKEGNIFLSIGSATNSGIAKKSDFFQESIYDKTPIRLELNGINYGKKNTGAFKEYGKSSKEGEVIEGEKFGNASIVNINKDTGKVKLYASGIRNVEGFDINSKGEIIAIVGGIEPDGERGVIRDSDYIYKIVKGLWYGWPDYSGGDKISSPRFTDGEKVKEVIKNPPETKVPTPMYQHKYLNTLEEIAVDREGYVFKKDTIIFYGKKENILYSINEEKVLNEIIKFDKNGKINDIIFTRDQCLLLDENTGYIYSVQGESEAIINKVPKIIIGATIVIMCAIIIVIINKKLKK